MKRSVLFLFTLLMALPVSMADAAPKSRLGKVSKQDFVVKRDGHDYRMRIKDIGDDDEGYIDYTLASAPNGETLVQIDGVMGVKSIKGVGEALKKEVLRRHPQREIRSQLVNVNGEKLLTVWAGGFPHGASDKNGEKLRRAVPALKFEGFDYEITAKATRSGYAGSIFLVMRAAKRGKGSITIENPLDLDQVLLASPQRSKISKSKLPKNTDSDDSDKESEAFAKAAGQYIAKLAKDKSKRQSFSNNDLVKVLWKDMDDACGTGGGNGGGWSKKCSFTKRGRTYRVQSRKRSSSQFDLDDRMESLVKKFIKRNG